MSEQYYVFLYDPSQDAATQLLSIREINPKENELYSVVVDKLQGHSGVGLFSLLYKNNEVELYVFFGNRLTVSKLFYDDVKWVPNIASEDIKLVEQVTMNVTSIEHTASEAPFKNLPNTVKKLYMECQDSISRL